MKRIFFRSLIFIGLLCMLFMLSSCSSSIDELYQLPQLSEQNSQLQGLIDDILGHGASYSPPSSGSHRQSVQLEDLDGDGLRDAISFFQVSGDERPLKVYLFSNTYGEFVQAAKIEGEGESIDCISYADMDGDGQMEIIIGWLLSSDSKLLSIYTIDDFQPVLVESFAYTDYSLCNLRGNGKNLFVVRLIGTEPTGEAVLCTLLPDGELNRITASLSSGVTSVSRIQTAPLSNGTNAMYVECKTAANCMFTDVFAFQGNVFANISSNNTEYAADPSGAYAFRALNSIYCTDINGDNVLDVPEPVMLNSNSESSTTYYAIRWYSYSSSGRKSLTLTTFHNFTEGWYFIFNDSWLDKLSIRRESFPGTRSIVFSVARPNSEIQDFLTISTLSGDNRENNAISGNRFVISTKGENIYTGELKTDNSLPFNVNKDLVSENFHLIYSEWINPEK